MNLSEWHIVRWKTALPSALAVGLHIAYMVVVPPILGSIVQARAAAAAEQRDIALAVEPSWAESRTLVGSQLVDGWMSMDFQLGSKDVADMTE